MAIVADYDKNAKALAKALCKVFEMPYQERQWTYKERLQIQIFSIMRQIEKLIYDLMMR